jgi:hypothetical protein
VTDKAEQIIRDADHAQALLEDPMIMGAFAEIEAELLSKWRGSPTRDTEGREAAWMMLRALDLFRAVFLHHVANGTVEREMLAMAARERAMNPIPS